MYIEMELLARERYQTRLREAEEIYRHRSLVAAEHGKSRASHKLPMPRMHQK